MLEKLLRSKAGTKILGTVLFREGLHLREISRRAGVSPPEAKRELDRLLSLGILKKEDKGNMVLFYPDRRCPFLKELAGLYLKTDGVFRQLAVALSSLEGVEYAFIYGSFASGEYAEKSDVDVLVVGTAGDDELSRAFLGVQRKTGREINYISWSEKDLKNKLAENRGFVKSVVRGKRIWLCGDEHEFVGIVGKKPG
ncbi:nucleotidyltransferase domain-containing protein [Candidatus Micrarchaeota archaeon]|nr:nucleotidyltransferase domain-containing protein [Candidatus Micrarchaeota archaeon]